jgi:methyl-accepting chemotaxis protein
MKTGNRRRRHLIMPEIQFEYFKLIIASLCLPTLVIAGCAFYLVSFVIVNIPLPPDFSTMIMPALRSVFLILLIGFFFITIFLLTWSLIASHRLAGPIYRLGRELDRIAEGNFSIRIRFRKKDRLQSLAESMNKVLDAFEQRLKST